MSEGDVKEGNFAAFRDCLFESVVSKLTPITKSNNKKHSKRRTSGPPGEIQAANSNITSNRDGNPSELADFSDFIATEIFPSLPVELQTLSYRILENNPELSEKWSLPLSLSVFEELAEGINPSVNDSLIAYGLVEPPKSDLQSFISPVITSYISAVIVAPPKWIATRATACEICDREWVPLTYHHLIPREVHAKVLKRGWHEEHMLNSVAWLCRACHSFVHKFASNEELARDWFTVERLCSRDDVQKWARWVGTVRWKKT